MNCKAMYMHCLIFFANIIARRAFEIRKGVINVVIRS